MGCSVLPHSSQALPLRGKTETLHVSSPQAQILLPGPSARLEPDWIPPWLQGPSQCPQSVP